MGSVFEGEDVGLTWTTAVADTCTASGDWSGNQPLDASTTIDTTGLLTVGSAGNLDFTLTCDNSNGYQTSETVSVTIHDPIASPTDLQSLSQWPGSDSGEEMSCLTGSGPVPAEELLLDWQVGIVPTDTTYQLYRSQTLPVITDSDHLVADNLGCTLYEETSPPPGTWYYVVTAAQLWCQ